MYETAASLRDNTARAALAREGGRNVASFLTGQLANGSNARADVYCKHWVPHKQNSVKSCTTQEWPGRGLVDQRSAWYKYSQLCSIKAWPSLSSPDTKLPMVLAVQNHDSWKWDQPSIKASAAPACEVLSSILHGLFWYAVVMQGGFKMLCVCVCVHSGGACSPLSWKCVTQKGSPLSESRAPAVRVAAPQTNSSR